MIITHSRPTDQQAGVQTTSNILIDIGGNSRDDFDCNLIGPGDSRSLIADGRFQDAALGPYSIIRRTGDTDYRIIIDLVQPLQADTHYQITLRTGTSPTLLTLDFSTTEAGEDGDSSLRHSIYGFRLLNNERLDNIDGFKYDETRFAKDDRQNNYVGMTSLWDASSADIDDGAFQSGIGYGDDIKPSKGLTKRDYSVGSFEAWSLEITHGAYYIGKYYNYLYSKDSVTRTDFRTALSPFAHSVMTLESEPKSGVPIMIATYNTKIGNYIPSLIDQKYQFSASDTSHNTFCCKYCTGTACSYLESHPFDGRYLSETMGKDYSEYYDNATYGRCDNTSCPGHILDNIEDNIMWDNVDTSTPEFIYVRDTNKVICNTLLAAEAHEPELFGYTNGATYQWVDLPHRTIVEDSTKVYIAGTLVTHGADVDLIGGRLQLSHNELLPIELRNTYGYAIQVEYSNQYELVYEPSDCDDYYIPTDLNLNPLYSGITRGFVSMINSPLDPDVISITTTKEYLGYTISDSKLGDDIPVYGPLTIGNDYGYIQAHVSEKSGKYGVPNVPVVFKYQDYSPAVQSNKEKTVHTNSEGNAIDAYAAPPDSDLQLVYLRKDEDTEAMELGVKDTIVLPFPIPRQCIVTEAGTVLVDLFAVYTDDPALGKIGADVEAGEVLWAETWDGQNYKTNGRKEIIYKWEWDSIYLQEGGYVPVTPSFLSGQFYLYDENDNLVTEPTDMVYKILYAEDDGDSFTTSLLPHNTDSNVGAYVITIPRYVIAYAEMDVYGFEGGEEYYKKSSNRIAFEVKLPDYMRGVFKTAALRDQDAKSLDGATYLTVDPMAQWDLSGAGYDPRALAHTFLVQGQCSATSPLGIPHHWYSIRQLIHVQGLLQSHLRQIIAARPINLSSLRQVIFAGNATVSRLRHVIQAVKEAQVGFDFTLDVVDPPSDGFDMEFNMHKAKQGGASNSGDGGGSDPTNPINVEFTPTGSVEIVSPTSPDWNRYGGAFGGESSGMAGGSGDDGSCSFQTVKYGNTGHVRILIDNIPYMGTKELAMIWNKTNWFKMSNAYYDVVDSKWKDPQAPPTDTWASLYPNDPEMPRSIIVSRGRILCGGSTPKECALIPGDATPGEGKYLIGTQPTAGGCCSKCAGEQHIFDVFNYPLTTEKIIDKRQIELDVRWNTFLSGGSWVSSISISEHGVGTIWHEAELPKPLRINYVFSGSFKWPYWDSGNSPTTVTIVENYAGFGDGSGLGQECGSPTIT